VKITTEVTRFARRSNPIRQSLDVRPWIEGLVDEMRGVLLERKGDSVLLEALPINHGTMVVVDVDQMYQVFSNLILNAADAIPAGGTITISVDEVTSHERLPEIETGPSRWLHWQVSDTGVGISPSVLDRIFEPLFTTKKQGTGLGLAVAQQIIKAHGGHLCVETTVGRGTTFHVFLPNDVTPNEPNDSVEDLS
jgi:signal transduction histidine kinase